MGSTQSTWGITPVREMLRIKRNPLVHLRGFKYAETGVSLYYVYGQKSPLTVEQFCKDVPGHERPVFMSEYEGALVGTDMTRPEFQSLRINPAYKAWEEEKMDPYSGPDGFKPRSEQSFFQRHFFVGWFLSFALFVVFWDRLQLIPWLHPPGYTPLRATDMFWSLVEGPQYVFGWAFRSMTGTETAEDIAAAEARKNRVVDPLMQYKSHGQRDEEDRVKKQRAEAEYRRQKVREAARAYQEQKRREEEERGE